MAMALCGTVPSVVSQGCPGNAASGAWRTNAKDGGLIALAVIPVLLAVGAAHAAQETRRNQGRQPRPMTCPPNSNSCWERIPGTITDGRLSARTKRLKSRRNCTLNSMRFTRSGISPWPEIEASSNSSLRARSGRAAMYSTSMSRPTATRRRDRKHDGIHNGVDYMFTVIDGDPNHASTRLDVFEADGRTRRGACNIVIREATLYLAAEMALQQQDGRSVFEYSVSSYVKDNGPSAGLGYCRVASAEAPKTSDARLLVNPDMTVINGTVPGWQLVGGSRPMEAKLAADSKDGALVLENLFWPEGLSQTVSLAPGHYLLRALAKTNVFQIHLVAESMRMPVAVSDEYQWVELPFCIPRSGEDSVTSGASRIPVSGASGDRKRVAAAGQAGCQARGAGPSGRHGAERPVGRDAARGSFAPDEVDQPVARLEPSGEGRLSGRLPRDRTVVDDPGGPGRPHVCRSPQFQPRRQVPAHRVPQAAARAAPDGRFRAVSERRLDGNRLAVPVGTEASARRVRSRGLDRDVTQPGRNPTAQRGDGREPSDRVARPFRMADRPFSRDRNVRRARAEYAPDHPRNAGVVFGRQAVHRTLQRGGRTVHDIPGAEYFLAAGRGHAVRRHVQCRRESRGQLARRGGPRRQPVFSLRDQPGPLPRPPDQSVSSLGPAPDGRRPARIAARGIPPRGRR